MVWRMWSLCCVVWVMGYAHGILWTEPVHTPVGRIRGQYSADGGYMYLGIPYAKVDESNPFGVATRYPVFDDTFDAIDDSSTCPQQEEFNNTIIGTLDCLKLNVFVPRTTDSKLAVVVWIHGGHFTIGFGGRLVADPKFLVDKNVVVVTINYYRLGVYGFMCLDTPEVPGNVGLKDQLLALKWINENIASFGGDPDRITVMGESAGAMSIDFHLMSDQPKLYQQAILQSGSGLVPAVILQSDRTMPFKIAEHLGFETDDMQQALSFLATRPTDLVIEATIELGLRFRVCIEKKFENVENIVTEHPHHIHNIAKVNNMSILAGFNSDEQMYLYINKPIEEIGDSFFYDYIAQEYNTEGLQDMIETVRKFYIGDQSIKTEVIRELIDFASDIKFNHPVQQAIHKYLDNNARVYQYMFSYDGDRNYVKVMHNIIDEGAAHGDELGYLFDTFFLPNTPSPADQKVIDAMTTMWANFAKYGNPTPHTTDMVPVIWPPTSKDMTSYLDINDDLNVIQGGRPYNSRMSFWDLFSAANKHRLWANTSTGGSSSPALTSFNCYLFIFITLLSLAM